MLRQIGKAGALRRNHDGRVNVEEGYGVWPLLPVVSMNGSVAKEAAAIVVMGNIKAPANGP